MTRPESIARLNNINRHPVNSMTPVVQSASHIYWVITRQREYQRHIYWRNTMNGLSYSQADIVPANRSGSSPP